ncbi:MAG: hypothetical protein NZT92_14720 [Abditibacteriales bacterium]|nr:hypothetical protein [Abditibacteriales bacterium]MDW8367732.1 hypothetical protein [Abditibacteriales bacterium]
MRLSKGKVTIPIYAREGGDGAAGNPACVPNDGDCRKALELG